MFAAKAIVLINYKIIIGGESFLNLSTANNNKIAAVKNIKRKGVPIFLWVRSCEPKNNFF